MQLSPEDHSVGQARRFVREQVQALGGDAVAQDAAALLASELATNAVLHAGTPFTVDVFGRGSSARVEIADASPRLPRQRTYGPLAATGRGLRLLSSLALEHGTERRPTTGKVVWFTVALASAEQPEDGLGAGFADLADIDWLAEVSSL